MPKYFLNLTNSHGPLMDEEGIDAPDLEGAILAAVDNIRGVLSHETLTGRLDLRGRVDIADPDGRTLATVPFSEAVEVVFPAAELADWDPARPDPDADRPR